jgi:hypothetical protein
VILFTLHLKCKFGTMGRMGMGMGMENGEWRMENGEGK